MKIFVCILLLFCYVTVTIQLSEEEPVVLNEVKSSDLEHFCKENGIFANPNDPSGETFIRCQIEAVEMMCLNGFHFNEKLQTCVANQANNFNKLHDLWSEILPCPVTHGDESHFLRNPYDCSMFYQCYNQDGFKRIDPHYCQPNMVFDEEFKVCITEEQFQHRNHGQACKSTAIPEVYKYLLQSKDSDDETSNREHYETEFQLNKVLEHLRKMLKV